MADEKVIEKLREIFENTIESGYHYDGDLRYIEYFDLYVKAAKNNQLFKVFGSEVFMFNYEYKDQDAVLIIFQMPVNTSPSETGSKNVAERVMEIVAGLEKCFIKLEYMRSTEVKEEKFVYVTAVKCLNNGG